MENQYRLSPEFKDKLPPVPAPRSWARIVAREWLILLACILVAIIIMQAMAMTLDTPQHNILYYFANFTDRPFDRLIGWVFVGAVYIPLQIIRSVVWAIKTLRQKT